MNPLKTLIQKIPIEQVVRRDFNITKSGSRYYRGVEHDSLIIDTERNLFYWNSLGIRGNAFAWLTKIKGMSTVEAIEVLREYAGIPYQKDFQLLLQPCYPYRRLVDAFYQLGRKYRDYWYSRGYTDATIDNFKLGYTDKFYVIPIINYGQLTNFQCRTPEKLIWSWTKGLGKQPFNFDILKNTSWTIITESPVDAILATQYGFPAISIHPNALAWDEKFTGYLVGLDTIYLIFDNDAAGHSGLRRVGKFFKNKAMVVDWDGYAYKTDVGDILNMPDGRVRLDNLISGALPYAALKNDTAWSFYSEYRRAADGKSNV